jgi:hypothetical protein
MTLLSTWTVRAVKVIGGAAAVLLAVGLAACSPSPASGAVNFGTNGATHYLEGGTYAVSVADDCGNPVKTVAAQIGTGDWTDPLLDGTPIAIPVSGYYTVVDPIGNDLIGNVPACSLALSVDLTPLKG